MLPNTEHKVENNTPADINDAMQTNIAVNTVDYEYKSKAEITQRLHELDQEWDTERVLETNASLLALTGIVLGATVNKKWLILPGLVTAFLFQHAIQGWCPPLPVIRKMGVRTSAEIHKEKAILQHLRGDYDAIQPHGT